MYLNGQWSEAENSKTFTVTNPANGQKISDVPDCSRDDAKKAILAAEKAF